MSSKDPFRILQTEFKFLKANLVLKGTKLIDHLFENSVLTPGQMEDLGDVSQNSKKIEKLVTLMMKRPPCDFKHFMDGLEGEQDHIKDHIQECLEKASSEESIMTDTEMTEDHESMDQDTGPDSECDTDEEESSDSEDDSEEASGQPLKRIKDFKMAPNEQNVTLHVKVMTMEQVEEKSNQKQFMAVVADATSAVDICVRKETLFDKFQPKACIILRNVTWNGKVLLTKDCSTATFASEILVPENMTAIAFGEGEPVPISQVLTLPDMSWFTLRGKVVKQSPLTRRKFFKKVLLYRQVKLKDDTGTVYVDTWASIAEDMQLGRVIQVDSCKKRPPLSPDDPLVTTTVKSSVKYPRSSELKHIRKDHYEKGKLLGIDISLYMSCPNPRCFHFQLTDMRCESCLRMIPVLDQVSYAKATVDVRTPRGNIHSLIVYWPELCQLFRLFKKKTPPEDNKEKIVEAFKDLGNKTVKYKACGAVSKFKL
ncbi:uncharacterized protein [Haliotis cracherodii]|uniref:uncharacterized protein n=1 Tax=Haliotis cracherodii TaxID=6455 RepID=UPI0039EA07E8